MQLQYQRNMSTPKRMPHSKECLVFQARFMNNSSNYKTNNIRLTEHTFKDRLYRHRNSFRHRNKINSTQLSKFIWNQRNNSSINIKRSILDRALAFQIGPKRYQLCLSKKLQIIFPKYDLFNKRNELLRYISYKCGSLEISWDDRWTFVKSYSQKNDFRAPDGDWTRNLLITGETI